MDQTIRIGIIEDEGLVLKSLTTLIESRLELKLVATSCTVEDFLDQALGEVPEVLLLDINLPDGMSGLEGISHLHKRFPNMEIIMLTTFDDSERVFKALCAGATAYLTKRTPFQKVVEAITTVHRGGSYMSPSIARKVVRHFAPKRGDSVTLSPRQSQIAEGILQGLSYKMIANQLLISTETVKDHIKKMYKKLSINSKAELMAMKMRGELD